MIWKTWIRRIVFEGYSTKRSSGGGYESGSSALPSLPEGIKVNVQGLGDHVGELGPFLDCPAIVTDASSQLSATLTLQHILEMASCFQGQSA